ncbi:MAG TPA: Uma2 family endonuclease [Blastocatellia bacterium]|nr:Uma2 family endonuclease [Blastocatellia bacterium]
MSLPKHKYTLEEYLALERESEIKYEFWNGEIYAMSGGSLAHDQIMGNVDRLIARQLEGKPCHVFTNNMQIKVPAAPPYRYADGSVVCGEIQVEEFNGSDLLVNPLVIWEVLSASTEAFNRGDKFTFYKSIPTFKEYLLIAQHRPHITHYVKRDDGKWDYEETNDLTAEIFPPTH